jgi:hypothetical protein
MAVTPITTDAWWSIHGTALHEMLTRAAAGEDPDVLYLELYVNSSHEQVGGGDAVPE